MGSKESSWGTTIFPSSWITHLAHLLADLKSGVPHLTKCLAISVEAFWHTFNLTIDWLESWIAGYGSQELPLIFFIWFLYLWGHTAWLSQIIPNFVLRNHFWKAWGDYWIKFRSVTCKISTLSDVFSLQLWNFVSWDSSAKMSSDDSNFQ